MERHLRRRRGLGLSGGGDVESGGSEMFKRLSLR